MGEVGKMGFEAELTILDRKTINNETELNTFCYLSDNTNYKHVRSKFK